MVTDTKNPPIRRVFRQGTGLVIQIRATGSRELSIRFVALLLKVDIRVTCASLAGIGRR